MVHQSHSYQTFLEHLCVPGTVLVLCLQRYIQNCGGRQAAHVLGTTTTTAGQDDNRAESGDEGGSEGLQRTGGLGFLEAMSRLGLKGGGGAQFGDWRGMALQAEASARTKSRRQEAECAGCT